MKKYLSIITPSYNQGTFITDTFDSILNQKGIENQIEYIVQDAKSTDNTLQIANSYKTKFKKNKINFKFISEKDSGQSNAINKGWKKSKGDIISYINSDDYYEPNVLKKVINFFQEHPDVMWAYGDWNYVNKNNKLYKHVIGGKFNKNKLLQYDYIGQPAVFIRKKALAEIGLLNESLHLTMDYDLWLRLSKKYPATYIKNLTIANLRCYSDTKSSQFSFRQFISAYKLGSQYKSNFIVKIGRIFYLLVGSLLALLKLDIANRIDKQIKIPLIDS